MSTKGGPVFKFSFPGWADRSIAPPLPPSVTPLATVFGVRQIDCSFDAVGHLTPKHVFEIFGWAIA